MSYQLLVLTCFDPLTPYPKDHPRHLRYLGEFSDRNNDKTIQNSQSADDFKLGVFLVGFLGPFWLSADSGMPFVKKHNVRALL